MELICAQIQNVELTRNKLLLVYDEVQNTKSLRPCELCALGNLITFVKSLTQIGLSGLVGPQGLRYTSSKFD